MLGWAAAACHVVAVVLWRMGARPTPQTTPPVRNAEPSA
jgi:hypothetical protein